MNDIQAKVITPQSTSKHLEKWGSKESAAKWIDILEKRVKIRRRRALAKGGTRGATKRPSGEAFKFGDIRDDGFRFKGYDRQEGGVVRAQWMSPEAWNRRKAREAVYQKSNRAELTRQERERGKNPAFALRKRIRRDVQNAPDLKRFAWSKIHDTLGCSTAELRTHLEQRFEAGMTWENRDKWYIGHKTPLGTATTTSEILRRNHYSNLVPRWTRRKVDQD